MIKKLLKPLLYIASVVFFLSAVISCEEDFTDVGTSIVVNNQFSTNDTTFFVSVIGKDIPRVEADGLPVNGPLGQYLLGVYNNPNYKKIEASIITQLSVPFNLDLVRQDYGADTIVISTIDTVLLRLPYQATFLGTDAVGPLFELDSVFGDQDEAFTLNVYRIAEFLNVLDPADPTQSNQYFSDDQYELMNQKLNVFEDTQFKPRFRDTAQFVLRRLSNGNSYGTDTITYINANPYISIPLKKDIIKEAIFDRYESSELSSQDAFNAHFRGLKIQAEGNAGSLISLNLNDQGLVPVMDIYYTNTVLEQQPDGSTIVVDTIPRVDNFNLSGIRNSQYIMSPGQAPAFNQVAVQGTAGSMAQATLMTRTQLNEFRTKDWLINDATLTVYVDKTVVGSDSIITPQRLFIYKDGTDASGNEVPAQLLDVFTETINGVGGFLSEDSSGNPDFYTFKITDYISELFSQDLNDLQPLGIKVFNQRDLVTGAQDTIVTTYNWSPQAVMLLNHEAVNGARRATLKISYSEKNIDDN
jgi:hypothetical protein